jgi:VWFA-related protein
MLFTLATGSLLRGEPPEGKGRRNEAAEELEAMFAGADARLRALAEASAGEAYFPRSPNELAQIYREIGGRLRNLYSLGYYPANTARDGSYRRISVELVGRSEGLPGRRVSARPGYFAPRE